MAISIKTVESTSASANNTSTVEATINVPDNCHTIVITNPDSTNKVLFAEGVADALNPLPAASSTEILPTKSFNLTCGTRSVRADRTFNLVYSTNAGSITVNVTYVCTNVI